VVKDKRTTEIKHEMSIDNKRVDEHKMRGQTGKYRKGQETKKVNELRWQPRRKR
jgi:hypothetical protein